MLGNQEDILDDENIKNKLLAPLEKELDKLSFWLNFSFFLLLIFGLLGMLISVQLYLGLNLYIWYNLIFVLGVTATFIIAFPMAYTHFKYAQSCKDFCVEESDEHFEKLLKSGVRDWRLLALAFVFFSAGIVTLLGHETYNDWYSRNYFIETPPQLPEINGENNLPPADVEAVPDEVQPIEEDPAPESE